jgi:hypothetical protein
MSLEDAGLVTAAEVCSVAHRLARFLQAGELVSTLDQDGLNPDAINLTGPLVLHLDEQDGLLAIGTLRPDGSVHVLGSWRLENVTARLREMAAAEGDDTARAWH